MNSRKTTTKRSQVNLISQTAIKYMLNSLSGKNAELDESRFPIRKKDRFCSPICGSGCTKEEFDLAVKGAESLSKALKSKHWNIVVFEDAGWHFKAEAGALEITGDFLGPGKSARYACLFAGRSPEGHWFEIPHAAVEDTLYHCIQAAKVSMETLFDACVTGEQTSEFYRTFTQLRSTEFLRTGVVPPLPISEPSKPSRKRGRKAI